jgi:hypothetical protein
MTEKQPWVARRIMFNRPHPMYPRTKSPVCSIPWTMRLVRSISYWGEGWPYNVYIKNQCQSMHFCSTGKRMTVGVAEVMM